MRNALKLLAPCALALSGCWLDFGGSGGTGSLPNEGFPGASGGGGGGDFDFCGRAVNESAPTGSAKVPAISGGTMAVLADGTVVAADADRDLLHTTDASAHSGRFVLPRGSEPGRVVAGPRDEVFVALRGTSQVAAVNLKTGELTVARACSAPRGLAYDAARERLWVACASGELARIDTKSNPWRTTVTHPLDDLRDVMMLDDGRMLVSTFRDARVWALNTETMSATLWSEPHSHVTDGITATPQVAWRTVRAHGTVTMVHQREQVDAVAAPGVCGSSYGSPSPAGGFGGGDAATVPTMETVVTQLTPPTADSDGVSELVALTTPVLPVDVAVNGDGSRTAIVSAGASLVELISNGSVQAFGTVGQPISAVFDAQDQLWVFTREPATLVRFDASGLTTTQDLGEASVQSTGHDLFHLDTGNGIACASCHPEAGEDGHVWNLPEGVRRTPSLRGGLSGTEPFHWSGEEADLSALMTDVFVGRMNGAPQSDQRLGALLGWLDAQPVRLAPGDLDASAVARGKDLFASQGCLSCHSGALGTNNTTVDVGTGEELQVPRLVELGYRAPFMHDGRAARLEDRFDPTTGGTMHGDVNRLRPDDIADLVAYLKSR